MTKNVWRHFRMTDIFNNIADKKVCVLGMGISNRPLIKFLYTKGARKIWVLDKSDSEETKAKAEALREEGVNFTSCFGEHYLDVLRTEKFDIVFKTPVVRYDLPELVYAGEQGAVITSEMEVFLNLCPAKIYAVTGSDGKTTTTTLIYKFLEGYCRRNGGRAWVGGNIGAPLLPHLDEIKPEDYVIVELSSFQLMHMKAQTDVSVITNISPNHLDVHKSYEEYIDAKKNIFLYGNKEHLTVLNRDNPVTGQMGAEVPGRVRWFSRKQEVTQGVYLKGTTLCTHAGKILDRGDILLPGDHNAENYMAAICAVMDTVPTDIILEVARTFGGVEHRMELVRELNGVKYYNSSIDSSPNRTIHALSVFRGNVVLIAGGKDKKIPYDDLGPVLADKVKTLILTGPTADKIEQSARAAFSQRGEAFPIEVIRAVTYEEAVEAAYRAAKPGDTVLLSPASTSFDMFRNFEERGNKFKQLVRQLK